MFLLDTWLGVYAALDKEPGLYLGGGASCRLLLKPGQRCRRVRGAQASVSAESVGKAFSTTSQLLRSAPALAVTEMAETSLSALP